MRYIDEFRDKRLAGSLAKKIKSVAPDYGLNIMEVCGTHTQSFFRFNLDKLLPGNIRLISGPGCPVCVSDQAFIDAAIRLAKDKNNIILTFGDMLRVPGTSSSLEEERAAGAKVHIVYSPADCIDYGRKHPKNKIIFLGVGFETTAPVIALSIKMAKEQKAKNVFFLTALKLIPPAIAHLLKDKRVRISGFLLPGHVSAVIGSSPYEFIPRRHKIPCCIAGFEPLDILEGVYMLINQANSGKPEVANQYTRVVPENGNPSAKKILSEVFKVYNASWRGLGVIPRSGLKIAPKYADFDARKEFGLTQGTKHKIQSSKCRCGDVLKGLIRPESCAQFGRGCTPDHPAGPCMVSSEGACNAAYRYKR